MSETQQDVAQYQSDHDLLVTLNERVKQLTEAVSKKNDDHEARIRLLESKVDAQESSSRTIRYILTFIIPIIIAALGWVYVQDFDFQSGIDARITKAINTSLVNYQLIRN